MSASENLATLHALAPEAPQILDIKPGDRFVIKLDCHASSEVVERVQKIWRSFAGDDARLLVLDKGAELSVLREQPASDVGVNRSDLLQRMASDLDDLLSDDTIGFSNGVRWIEVATVAEIREAAYPSPETNLVGPADQIISQIEELFPNWRAYRDLVDCITCELHELRQRAEAGR